ncbi:hypothetical protein [Thalassospira profundimaris]|uniref:NYN domain-containing protein n=1 Tax=Thalassospira profundimaris TaxID=502049 RepID=A0A367WRI0_9PROT|nr:hypothetical protein [Thalassospira profundimaris]RCK43210.1 hypothetical protein TH30_19525 [Thalassospira profundimaris]
MNKRETKPLHLLIDGDQISSAAIPAILQALYDHAYQMVWPVYVYCNEKAEAWSGVMSVEQLELTVAPQIRDAADIAITLQAGRLIERGANCIAIASADRLFMTTFALFRSYDIEAVAICPAKNIMRKQLALHADKCILFHNIRDSARGSPAGVAPPPKQEPVAEDLRELLEQLCGQDHMVELQTIGDFAAQLGIRYSASLSKQIGRLPDWEVVKSHRVLYAKKSACK